MTRLSINTNLQRAVVTITLMGFIAVVQSGCGAPWRNLVVGDLAKLKAAQAITVKPATFDNLKVGKKTEEDYLKEKKDETAEKWSDNKALWAKQLGMEVSKNLGADIKVDLVDAEAAPEGVVITANFNFIEPGFYAAVVNKASMSDIHVKIVAMPSTPIAEFDIAASTSPTEGMPSVGTGFGSVAPPRYPSSGGRIGRDVEKLGALIARFIKEQRKAK